MIIVVSTTFEIFSNFRKVKALRKSKDEASTSRTEEMGEASDEGYEDDGGDEEMEE